MIVGDDDQAIYRFQGADLSNMQQFQQRYADDLALFVLDENYRSTQPILDYAGRLIAHNTERILSDPQVQSRFPGLSKQLTAKAPHASGEQDPPQIHGYENQAQELLSIEDRIAHLVQHAQVKPEEIAVLYRTHRDAHELAQTLRARGIEIRIQRKENVLGQPVVQHLLEILRFCYEAYRSPGGGGYSLFRILNFPYWGLPPRAVQSVIAHYTLLTYNTESAASAAMCSRCSKTRKTQVGLDEAGRAHFVGLLKNSKPPPASTPSFRWCASCNTRFRSSGYQISI